MPLFAIVLLGVLALMLVPVLLLLRPDRSAWASGESTAGLGPAGAALRRAAPGVGARSGVAPQMPLRQPAAAPRVSGHASAPRSEGADPHRFMLRPDVHRRRRFVPHRDGYADIPLFFSDGRGSCCTVRWRLCVN